MEKLYFILFCLFSATSVAQNKSISGFIKDTQNEPLVGVTIKLFQSSDSSQVSASTSDLFGKFAFNKLENNTYYLILSAITQKPYRSVSFKISDENPVYVLPTIFMLPANEIQLQEVIIKTKRPLIEQDIDKTIVNVEAMISAATSNALEVLARTPGILIDAQGTINLNGRSGVLVLIDGRSTYMSGQDLAAYLRSLPGGMLDKLELMDNPPAKYDASGSSIINIVLKRNRALGLTGTMTNSISQGQKTQSYNSLNLNLNRQKINLFMNLGYNLDGNFYEDQMEREIYSENGILQMAIQGISYSQYQVKDISNRLGVDINASKNTVIGMQLFYQTRPKTESADFLNESQNLVDTQKLKFTGYNEGDFKWNRKGVNLNFNHKLNPKGRELSADLNYINYVSSGQKNFNTSLDGDSGQVFDNKLLNQINIYNFKADYVHPFAKGVSFETGIKTSYVKNDNDALFENLINNIYQTDFDKSNHFIYNENIKAAYVNYRRPISKRINAQVGLRIENTYLLGELLANQVIQSQSFRQNFTNIFPSIFLSSKLDSLGHHVLNLTYVRRIDRPSYMQFNPFLNYLDSYTYSQGNTELRPFYLNAIQLRYQYKQLYNLTIGYDGADGIFGDITIRRGEVFIKKPYNVGAGFKFYMNQFITITPTQKWNSTLSLQLAYFQINGSADGVTGQTNFYRFRIYTNNQFDFGKGWSGEVMVTISGKDNFYPLANLGKTFLNLAFQKKILKDKGSLKLSIDDVFYGNFSREVIANFQNTYQYRKSTFDSRRVGIAFSYRFGNQTFARKRRHQDNAAESEMQRVQ